jgi:periplasmic divalent cation tolerance protein
VRNVVQIETALGSESEAAGLAAALVEERLAACVQVLGPMQSTYRWRGRVERSIEWLCRAKTTASRSRAALARIRELHSYEQPEILVIPVSDGDDGYLGWVADQVEP